MYTYFVALDKSISFLSLGLYGRSLFNKVKLLPAPKLHLTLCGLLSRKRAELPPDVFQFCLHICSQT